MFFSLVQWSSVQDWPCTGELDFYVKYQNGGFPFEGHYPFPSLPRVSVLNLLKFIWRFVFQEGLYDVADILEDGIFIVKINEEEEADRYKY